MVSIKATIPMLTTISSFMTKEEAESLALDVEEGAFTTEEAFQFYADKILGAFNDQNEDEREMRIMISLATETDRQLMEKLPEDLKAQKGVPTRDTVFCKIAVIEEGGEMTDDNKVDIVVSTFSKAKEVSQDMPRIPQGEDDTSPVTCGCIFNSINAFMLFVEQARPCIEAFMRGGNGIEAYEYKGKVAINMEDAGPHENSPAVALFMAAMEWGASTTDKYRFAHMKEHGTRQMVWYW